MNQRELHNGELHDVHNGELLRPEAACQKEEHMAVYQLDMSKNNAKGRVNFHSILWKS